MEVNVINSTKQEFNGQCYWACGNYYQRKGKRLHRAVWEYHNGDIPKGCVIHHLDHDRGNNQISNLVLKPRVEHSSYHSKLSDHSNWIEAQQEGAKKWHRSEEGREWHKKHYREDCESILRAKTEKKCAFCASSFNGVSYAKYCSRRCQQRSWKISDMQKQTASCLICGAEFKSDGRQGQQTCSRKCSALLTWKTRKANKDRAS